MKGRKPKYPIGNRQEQHPRVRINIQEFRKEPTEKGHWTTNGSRHIMIYGKNKDEALEMILKGLQLFRLSSIVLGSSQKETKNIIC